MSQAGGSPCTNPTPTHSLTLEVYGHASVSRGHLPDPDLGGVVGVEVGGDVEAGSLFLHILCSESCIRGDPFITFAERGRGG